MTDEQTEYQTADGRSSSQELSLQATTPPTDVPGYRLSRFLGAGAFGQVWVGQDLNTGRTVAVKFYLHRGGVNWSLLSREVKNLVQLSADRQVVQVLEVGWDADPPYYVMEWVAGGSLEDYLKEHPRMAIHDAVSMFQKICVGLNHCHAKGVLHCDIKPANILLGDDHEPRLADFGQSRLSHEQTPSLGTLFYMAPEQADLNSSPDASWDVYAVGAILYRMLTGEAPYRDQTVIDQIDTADSLPQRLSHYRNAIENSPSPEKQLVEMGVDRPLARIVSRCLAVQPQERYENVQQILQDLSRRRSARERRPLMLLGIVGPLLILLATTFFGYRSIQQARTQTEAALRDEAFDSNKLAAKFAARTLESEIERYYDLVNDEATVPGFVEALRAVLADPEISDSLAEISAMRVPRKTQTSTAPRDRLLDAESRERFVQWLSQRLKRYTQDVQSRHSPRLATMFVTDSVGTILAVAYDEPVLREKNSAGKNFAYRTYFHGGEDDLPKTDALIGRAKPLRQTHLSAAFPSTATGLWKVAVSTPIYLSDDRSRPDAIFVVTINLGDFELLQSEQGANQIAVLVEAREGSERGTILQHPLMDQRRTAGMRAKEERYRIDASLVDRLSEGGYVNYRDPLADAADGKAYVGEWIAAMQPVALPRSPVSSTESLPAGSFAAEATVADNTDHTDLLVLVQYRLEKVMAPVTIMQSALLFEGIAALASILLVTLVLWWFVRRVDASKPLLQSTEQPTLRAPPSTVQTPQ